MRTFFYRKSSIKLRLNNHRHIKIIECPRDAMQGLHDFIPTETKAHYINSLLDVGFDSIDFGSFVSPKAIPQLKDTPEVLAQLKISDSKLLAIVANRRGAEDAVKFKRIKYLGFPFSVSDTFQLRNTNSTLAQSFETVKDIQQLCNENNKELVIYLSMGFGNPYGDEWNAEIVSNWAEKIQSVGVKIISLADTVGVAKPADIHSIFTHLIEQFNNVEFGAHLHCTPDNWMEKTDAAFKAGCNRFDAAIKGFGGCPMAEDKLTGNLATENLVKYLLENNVTLSLDMEKFNKCIFEAVQVFNQ
jgi:hydroxymethylglutaryl-CoA lyase